MSLPRGTKKLSQNPKTRCESGPCLQPGSGPKTPTLRFDIIYKQLGATVAAWKNGRGPFLSALALLALVVAIVPPSQPVVVQSGAAEKRLPPSERSSPTADEATLHHLARSYLLTGEYDAAAATFRRLLTDAGSASSRWPQASHYGLALIALAQGQPSARAHLEQVSLATADAKLADRARRLETLVWQLEDEATERRVRLGILGTSLLAVGEMSLARRSLEEAVALFPEYAEAISLLGYLAWMEGDYPRADDLLQRALRLQPDAPLAHYFLGVLRRGEGRLSAAASSFERVIALDPGSAPAFVELGRTQVLARQYAAAAWALERAVELEPTDVEYLLVLARFYLDHALALERALIIARQAADLEPNDPRVLDMLGWALWTNGRANDALKSLEAAVAADPDLASAHYHLAVVLERTGDPHAAARAYLRTLELDPNGPSAARARATLGALVLP